MADSTNQAVSVKTTSPSFSRAPVQPADILRQFTSQLPAQKKAIEDSTAQQVIALQASGDAAKAAGEAQAESIRAKGEADAMERARAVSNAKLFGVGTEDDAVVAAHQKRAEAIQKMDKLRPVIDAEDAVAWWDDPLRWITNQFTQPILKTQYNAASREAETKTAEISTIQQQVQQRQAIDLAPTETLIKKTADQLAIATAQSATAKARELEGRAAEGKAQAAMQFFAMNKTSADMALSVARMMQDREMTSTQLAIHNDNLSRMKKEEKETLDILSKVNMKQRALGQAEFTLGEWKQLNAPRKEGLMMNSRNLSSIGGGTADTIEQIYFRDAQGSVAKSLPSLHNFITEQLNGPTAKKIQQEFSIKDAFNKLSAEKQQIVIAQELEVRQAKERTNSFSDAWASDNPNKLDFTRIQQRPDLQNNRFVKSIQAAQLKDSRVVFTDKDILLEAEGLARANPKDIPTLARDLQQFYKVGLLAQWRDDGPMWAGLPVQEQYGVSANGRYVDSSGVTRGLMVTDLPSVEHYLVQNATRRGTNQVIVGLTGQVVTIKD